MNTFVGHASCIRATVAEAGASHTVVRVSTGETLTLQRRLSFTAGSAIVLTARPEDLTLSAAPSPVSLKAELAMSIPHGPNVIHSLALADGTEIRVTEPRDRAGAGDRDGTQLFVGLDVTKLHAFPAEENQTPTSQEH
ncbi:MAG: TOBE domain-containing protein [Hyphomicrobiaceae bacterium]|nr:TOBE domain-containing protein [Hyphomicrobiaceae bacterium]